MEFIKEIIPQWLACSPGGKHYKENNVEQQVDLWVNVTGYIYEFMVNNNFGVRCDISTPTKLTKEQFTHKYAIGKFLGSFKNNWRRVLRTHSLQINDSVWKSENFSNHSREWSSFQKELEKRFGKRKFK